MLENPQQTVEYREARLEDFGGVARVWRESALSALDAVMKIPSQEELQSRIDEEIASRWALTVAVREGEIVGFLALKPTDAMLDQLFVLPSAQRRGIGGAFLDHAKRVLPGGFRLRTAAANERACRFYVRSGLALIEEGTHPRSGHAVRYYGWNVA